MALPQDKKQGQQWQNILAAAEMTLECREYLSQCRIKKIAVSQANKAWEIYFSCPADPQGSIRRTLKEVWENLFGRAYETRFHFEVRKTYPSLDLLCQLYWEEIIEKLAGMIPSSRGWLAGAEHKVEQDNLQLIIHNELGWSYLVSRGAKENLQGIISQDYGLSAYVTILLGEQEDGDSCRLEEQIQEIENSYRDLLLESREKAQPKKQTGDAHPEAVLGKKIAGNPVPINSVLEEENNVIVRGYIFNLEQKLLKSGRTLFSFSITDKTDSLACKIISDGTGTGILQEKLKEKSWYLLRGMVQVDRYTQELTLLPRDVAVLEAPGRVDEEGEKRVELHLHTKMSALDAVCGVKDIVKRAISWGHKAVAITDHGVVQAFPDAYEAAGREIKIIYGVEAYIFDEEENTPGSRVPTYHCIILAVNQEGLRNLYELVTISHLEFYYRVPRIPKSRLTRLRQGLLVGSACEAGEVIRAYLKGARETQLEEIAGFYDYLEIQPRGNNKFMVNNGTFQSEEDILEMNRTIYKLGHKLGKPVVASGDVHFLDPEDEVHRRILMTGKGFEDADQQAPLYFHSTREMLDEFAYLGTEAAYEVVIKNPGGIADTIEVLKPIPDDFYPPEIPGAEDEIANLTRIRARELYGDPLPSIVENRIEKELHSIISNGFAVLYLIAHKLVKKSNEDGYLVGSRGSVGSSLAATFCGITEVNPLPPHYRCPSCRSSKFFEDGSIGSGPDLADAQCPRCGSSFIKDGHDTPFEVFLGFKGDKVPDIDLNFSGEYQPRAHKYTEELFGRDNVFRAGTIATVANKTAFGFVKNYFADKGKAVRTAEVNRLVDGCTGVKRTTGQHPGGIMVLPKGLDVHLFTPLQKPADDVSSDTITTHFDYHAISSRLVKLDILGHDDPTVLKMLEDLTGVDCRKIPLDEPQVLSLFRGMEALNIDPQELGSKIGTLGIPEFNTKFVRQMLEETRPETFSDLVRISGLSHGTDVWLNNAQDLIKAGTVKLSEVICTRDDIMVYLIYQGVNPGQAFKVMEDVRKGKGIKNEDVQALKEHNVPPWFIDSCQKIKYMFPKAHAVAYVMMAFRIAYFKVYYPAAFYAAYFTVRAAEFDADAAVGGIPAVKKKMEEIQRKGNEATQKEDKLYTIMEVILEMLLRGIRIKKVDLLRSDATRFIIEEEGRALLPPFVSLQGLGQSAALGIYNARSERPFTSREDLRVRAKISKTVIECLESHGCIETLPENDQITLF